jgi:O-methyltransferase
VGRRLATEVGTSDLPQEVKQIIDKVWRYTLTSKERIAALTSSIEYVVANNIPGAIVECGVWKGGSLLAAILRLQDLGVRDRDIYGFDTFCGMTEPSEVDIDYRGVSCQSGWKSPLSADTDSSLADVRSVLRNTQYAESRIRLIPGRVEDTLPAEAPEGIALLRLDTDWYESTFHELQHLFPRLAVGGIVIIDDYGHYQGCQKAVDEYFAAHRIFLHRIDYTGRIGVKQGN